MTSPGFVENISLIYTRQRPRGNVRGLQLLLLDKLRAGWLDEAKALQCAAVVCQYSLWDTESVAKVHSAGMRALSYTVNDESVAHWLWQLGTDGIVTDRVDLFSPA